MGSNEIEFRNSHYLYHMPLSFSTRVSFDGKTVLAVIIPQSRPDGIYYEVNIKGQPRFYMRWSAIDRYDQDTHDDVKIPYNLLLAVSDAIELEVGPGK